MSSRQKKLDERNAKAIRELATLPTNKHCFDCHQRGPTYVDMTVGTFVCTACSGLLRGINPPHRVKSISMATFTSDDIEMLKTKGNEANKSIWLGLFDGNASRMETYRDEQHIKDFLIMKYERKRWYVSPNEIDRQRRLMKQAQANMKQNTQPSASAAPPKPTTTTEDLFSLMDANPPSSSAAPSQSKSAFSLMQTDPFASPPRQAQQPLNDVVSVEPSLFSQVPPPVATPVQSAFLTSDAFADFANFDAQPTLNNGGNVFQAPLPHAPHQQQPQAHMFPVSFDENGGTDAFSAALQNPLTAPVKSNTMPTFQASAIMTPQQPLQQHPNVASVVPPPTQVLQPPAPQQQQPQVAAGDKYSALADLDSLFSSACTTNGALDMTMPSNGGGANHGPTGLQPAVKPLSTEPLPQAGVEINWSGASMFASGTPKAQPPHQQPQFNYSNPTAVNQNGHPPSMIGASPMQPMGTMQHAAPPQQQQQWGAPMQPQQQQSPMFQAQQPQQNAAIGQPNWNPFLS